MSNTPPAAQRDSQLMQVCLIALAAVFLLVASAGALGADFDIRTSSNRQEASAAGEVESLRKKGYAAYYRLETVPGSGKWYCVYMRRFASGKPVPQSQAGTSGGTFVIRTSSNRKKASAESEVESLRKKGYAAYYRLENVEGSGKWYRVYMHRFASETPVAPAGTPKGSFTIRTSSNKAEASAETEVESLREKGYAAYYRLETPEGLGKMYRVYICGLTSGKKAWRTAAELKKRGVVSNCLVRVAAPPKTIAMGSGPAHRPEAVEIPTIKHDKAALGIPAEKRNIAALKIQTEKHDNTGTDHISLGPVEALLAPFAKTAKFPPPPAAGRKGPSGTKGYDFNPFSFKDAEEGLLNMAIRDLSLQGLSGARGAMKDRAFLVVDLGDLADIALGGNLDLAVVRLDRELAKKAETGVDARFDPVLNIFARYTYSETRSRSDYFYRRHEVDVDNESYVRIGSVSVDDIEQAMDKHFEDQFETSWIEEYASFENRPDLLPGHWTFGMNLAKTFHWGQQVNLSVQSTYNDVKYPGIGAYGTFYFTDAEYLYGDKPWISDLAFNLTTPLPYCKNFGKGGSPLYHGRRLARIETAKAVLAEEAAANRTLQAVLSGYWELVASVKRLQIITEHARNLAALAEASDLLLGEGEITLYDNAQVNARWKNMADREEIAWTGYMTRASRLVELLGRDPGALLALPAGYGRRIMEEQPASLGQAQDNARTFRADLMRARKEQEAFELTRSFRANQMKPDLSFELDGKLSQVDTYYGYESWEESMGHLFDPDTSYLYVGLNYVWPVGNRAAKAAFRQAEIAERRNRDTLSHLQIQIAEEVNTAISRLRSTGNQRLLARRNLDIARHTYSEAFALHGDREVSRFELLKKYDELLGARLAYLDALVGYRQAAVDLSAAQGLLTAAQ